MAINNRGNVTRVGGTVGGTATVVLVAPPTVEGRNFLQIQCTHPTNTINYTLDGTTPVSGTTGMLLAANGGAVTYAFFVPSGPVTLIASGAGTTYEILWA